MSNIHFVKHSIRFLVTIKVWIGGATVCDTTDIDNGWRGTGWWEIENERVTLRRRRLHRASRSGAQPRRMPRLFSVSTLCTKTFFCCSRWISNPTTTALHTTKIWDKQDYIGIPQVHSSNSCTDYRDKRNEATAAVDLENNRSATEWTKTKATITINGQWAHEVAVKQNKGQSLTVDITMTHVTSSENN